MADTASLVARVKTDGVVTAEKQLDAFSASATNATNATNRLTPAVSQVDKVISQAASTTSAKLTPAISAMEKAATNAATGGLSKTRIIAQQAGYQIQDMIVQIQGGTSAFVVFGQQGSQLAGAFGPSGAVVGALIALGSVIANVAFNARGAAADLKELEAAGSRISSLRLDTLVKINDATRDFASSERLSAYKNLGNQVLDLTTKYENQQLATKRLREEAQAAQDALQDVGGFTGPSQEEATARLAEANRALNQSLAEEAAIRSQVNGLQDQQYDLAKAEREEKEKLVKAAESQAKSQQKLISQSEKQAQVDAKRFEQQQKNAQAYIEQLQRDNDDELTLVAKHEQDKLDVIASYRDQGLITAQEYEASRNEISRTARDERLKIAEDEYRAQSQMQYDKAKDAQDKQDKEDAARQKSFDDWAEGQRNLTNDLKSTLGEQNAVYKASAIVSATIDTYKAATGAYAALSSIPYVGPALGAAAAGVAIAAGFKQVQAIRAAREQGGEAMAGRAYNMAEKGKAEVIVPSSNSRVRTAQQMKQIMGESGSNKPASISIVNQTTGRVDQVDQQYDNNNNLILTIREVVSNDLADSNSRISKTRTQTRNMAGFA